MVKTKNGKGNAKLIDLTKIDPDNICKCVKDLAKYCKGRIKYLEKEINNLKSNKTYKKLDNDYKFIRDHDIYVMTDKEKTLLEKFKKKHSKCCQSDSSSLTYTFYGNGLVSWFDVKCEKCNKKIEIYDKENW